ncbi:MAG TPA: flagellar hook capping protein [Ignavibacteria bacterium]|nr:flagellar hook capping protein [Ignavibacteria bacterium]
MLNSINTSWNNGTPQYNDSHGIMGKDDFLKLMIEQLKNQDPLNPMDSHEFAAQLAQFSSLEQLSNINTSLRESIDSNYLLAQSVNNTLTATLIGKDVKFESNVLHNQGENTARIGYNLPANAKSVTINIYDESGKIVRTIEGKGITKGDHKLSWDFTDNDGRKLANGKYTFKVEVESNGQEQLSANVFQYGTITGVKFTESGTKIMIDNIEYYLSDILEILNSTQTSNTGAAKADGTN